MRTNVTRHLDPVFTHEGAKARHITPLQELRRMTLAALLFEDSYYESGSASTQRVAELVQHCKPFDVANLAIECRQKMHLRHMPLFLVRELARTTGKGQAVHFALKNVIQRPDELAEYLALYWKDGRQPLSRGSVRGLRDAYSKFNAYQLAKYNRDHAVKLADVMRLVHPKPQGHSTAHVFAKFGFRKDSQKNFAQSHRVRRDNSEQSNDWRQLLNGTLSAPDTWEVALSGGANKKDTFERLLRERKLGGLAFLRNLRLMVESGVNIDLIRDRFNGNFDRVLPFRFIAALQHAPQFVNEIDTAMRQSLLNLPKMAGETTILIDVSDSMNAKLSAKSDLSAMDAACALAVLVVGICDHSRVFTFSSGVVEVPAFHGLGLVKAIKTSQEHMSTYLGAAVTAVSSYAKCDRLIVFTDEQSHDVVTNPTAKHPYMINVANHQHGIGYGPWIHVDGFSERVIDFIQAYESEQAGAE